MVRTCFCFQVKHRRNNHTGYVLVLTIAMLAALMVAASFVSQRISSAQDMVRMGQVNFAAQKKMDQSLARLLFTLATSRRTREGFLTHSGVLHVDGRWYDAGSSVRVSIQDARGLINLSGVRPDIFERYLMGFGMSVTEQGAASDSLMDYIDADSLVRLQGGEANEYARAGLSAPRNTLLTSPKELGRVLGWQTNPSLWSADGVLAHSYVARMAYINPNTATWRTLSASTGISEAEARRLIQSKKNGSELNLMSLLVEDKDFLMSPFVDFPGPAFLISFNAKGMSWAQSYFVEATPGEDPGAWRINYAYRRPIGEHEAAEALPLMPWGIDRNDKKRVQVELPF